MVYTTDDHVFVHMNKAAGVFVKDWMIKHLDAKVHRYKHAPIRMLNTEHRHKFKIGCTRNPYTWYISYYNYLCQQKKLTSFSFRKFIESYVLHPRALFDFMGKKVRKQFENLYPPQTDLPIGAWTYHHINYFQFDARKTFSGHGDILHHDLNLLMRTETLEDNMGEVFGPKHVKSIKDFPKKNVSKKRKQEYFTHELSKWVEIRDGQLMEHLGYGNPY